MPPAETGDGSALEMQTMPGFKQDPVGDLDARAAPGLLDKYQGRALLVTTGPVRHIAATASGGTSPYSHQAAAKNNWHDALDYSLRRQTCLVIHAQEIHVLHRLRAAGIPLLNQSELLKGINDSANVLNQLSKRRHQAGVLPYYPHLPDRLEGATHFEADKTRAIGLMYQLRKELPG